MKSRVYEILEASAPEDGVGQAVNVFLIVLIGLNAVALVISTVQSIYDSDPMPFEVFEATSVAIFTVEYLLRLWACTEDPKYTSSVLGRLRFAASPLLFIDLVAILPFYLLLFSAEGVIDLRFLRTLRLFSRLTRLGSHFSGIQTIGRVLRAKNRELGTVVLFLGLLLLLASSLMFYAENEAQPDKFSSIPAAMWWSIVTLTTVGYGDVFPVTGWGQALTGVIAMLGIGLFALPAGILGSGFLEEIQRRDHNPQRCPHCGLEITE